MEPVDPLAFYNIKNQDDIFYTAVYGDTSSKLEPVHNMEQARNCIQSWIQLEKTEGGIYITWQSLALSEKFRTVTDKLILRVTEDNNGWITLTDEESGDISAKIKFVKIPDNIVKQHDAGFIDSEQFPSPLKMTIDESKGISVLGDLLFPGMPVPVTIKSRNNVSILNFGGKFLTLQFSNETPFSEMKTISKTVNYNSTLDTIQYILTDNFEEQGPYSSSLFRIIEVELDTKYRIENFHFPGTFVNVSDEGIFFPSILSGSTSEITLNDTVKEEIKAPVEPEELSERDQLYLDLGLDPEAISSILPIETATQQKQPATQQKQTATQQHQDFKLYVIIGLILLMLLLVIM